ncbi:hypothetical protein PENTCL1PPCAC_21705, partial [Pristionchus entomophagus]
LRLPQTSCLLLYLETVLSLLSAQRSNFLPFNDSLRFVCSLSGFDPKFRLECQTILQHLQNFPLQLFDWVGSFEVSVGQRRTHHVILVVDYYPFIVDTSD